MTNKTAAFKGITFYAEMPLSMKAKHHALNNGMKFTREGLSSLGDGVVNVIAVERDTARSYRSGGIFGVTFDASGTVVDTNPGMVAGISVSDGYLRDKGLRISRKLAKQLHPQLIAYLERGYELSRVRG